MTRVRETLALINEDDIKSICTFPSSTTISDIQHVNNDPNARMILSIRGDRNNNNSRRSKLTVKEKHKKTTNRKTSKRQLAKTVKKQKSKIKPSRLKKTQDPRQKRTHSSTNRGRSSSPISKQKRKRAVIHFSPQRQHRLKATTIGKIQSAQNRKKSTMTLHQPRNKVKKSRGNSPSRVVRQQRFSSLSKTPTTQASRPQSIQAAKVKQHNFEKRDRTTSLMALQALAEKIAIYKEKYGDIETRHSSIVVPPKSHTRQKQRKR